MPHVLPSAARGARSRVLLTLLLVALLSVLAGALPTGLGGSPADAATTLGQRADAEARRHVGAPYQYGAAGPSRFDCSGFTMYVYGRLGKELPHNAASQYSAVPHVSRSAKRVGDLIFTKRGGKITHVGVYAGGSDIWSPVQSGDHVRRQSFAGRDYLVGRVG